jgi:hypothetical protein
MDCAPPAKNVAEPLGVPIRFPVSIEAEVLGVIIIEFKTVPEDPPLVFIKIQYHWAFVKKYELVKNLAEVVEAPLP